MRHAELSPVSVRNVLLRQIRGASRALRKQEILTDETSHQARKKLKRARASLRLVRNAVGKSIYARENAELRDAGRSLGGVRDAKAVLDALEHLLVHEKKAPPRAALLKLRRVLQEALLRLHREAQRAENLQAGVRSVEEAASRVAKWRVSGHGSAVLQAGIERIYRKGRKALAQAESDRSDDNLHEARKQAKYIAHAMEIFAPLKVCYLTKRIRRAESVADCLGEDHDLAILQDRIATLPAGPRAVYKSLLASLEHRRKKLQQKALKQGRRLYKSKAKAFIGSFKTQAHERRMPIA